MEAVRPTLPRPHTIWFRQPAKIWDGIAGRLTSFGAMVFGGVADERLQLNEDTLPPVGENRTTLGSLPERPIVSFFGPESIFVS